MATDPVIADLLNAPPLGARMARETLRSIAEHTIETALTDLREEMEQRFEDVERRVEVVDRKVEEANLRLARIEEKTDDRFDTILNAVLEQNKAASQGSIFMNPSVQVIAAIALLMLLAGALGKDFIITSPVVDITTTEGP
jgi:hypothetical protein